MATTYQKTVIIAHSTLSALANYLPGTFLISLLFFAFSGIFPLQAKAQTANGIIAGRVVNEEGNPIPNVTVRATIFEGPHWRKDATTDPGGYYEITGLEPENYLVKTLNDHGYVDEYYNDALNKQNAVPVKVNLSARVEDINFMLGQGGFISGRVIDTYADTTLPGIEIQFIDFQTNELNGVTLTDSEGEYISPALKPGQYAVKAFGVSDGYIPIYWPNASDIKNAAPVEVLHDENTRHRNFRLQTGGVLAGTIYENSTNLGIDSVWVVVLDSNEAWVSQAWTKNGGHYTAGGLRTGNYKVWIYEVNPWKYRAKYYQNASNFEHATWIPVTFPETTSGIDLYLDKVTTAKVNNEYIEIAVTDKFPGTNLTIGTTGGLETQADDNQSLLNGHPYPIMSYSTIRIDNQNYRFSSKEGNSITPPTASPDQKSIIRTWETQQVEVTQKTSLVTSEWASQPREDTAMLEYIIVNQDNVAHEIGLRILFDTKLGETDGAPIDIPYYGASNYEQEFLAENMPPWWTAKSIINGEIVFSAQGTLQDFGATTPDRFAIARYEGIMPHKWDYEIDPNEQYTSDSAVSMWWFPREIAAGESLRIITYYGLGEDTPDLEAPEIIQYIPEKYAKDVTPGTQIRFLIEDKKSGVDTTQIEIEVNGEPVEWWTEGSLRQLSLFCRTKEPLQYNQEVEVRLINIQDNAPVPNRCPEEIYTFTTIWDSLGPFTKAHNPPRFGREVPLHPEISFIVSDSLTGVDLSTFQFKLDGIPVPFEVTGTPREYFVSFQADSSFHYNETHTVEIDATDLAPTPNVMPTDRYEFYTLVDTLAPVVSRIIPVNGAEDVSIHSSIIIELEDTPAGVDTNSIVMTVESDTIKPVLSGDINHLTLTYVPVDSFPFGEQIDITLLVKDLSNPPNQMSLFESSFQTQFPVLDDTLAPVIVELQPPNGATNVNPRPQIQLTLEDDYAGINVESIKVFLNAKEVAPQIDGNSRRYFINFQPAEPLDFGSIVTAAIEAEDLASKPNKMDRFEWQFTIVEDHDAPFVSDFYPAPDAKLVYLNAKVQCNIHDLLSGVNIDSVQLLINNERKLFSFQGDSTNYRITYQPEIPWQNEQKVNIEVRAQDLSLPPNQMEPAKWAFTTSAIFDSIPPYSTNHVPARGAKNVSSKTPIMVHIKDISSGVDSSTIELEINNEIVSPRIDGTSLDYLLIYEPPENFEFNQDVSVRINARDFAGNEMPEDNYIFSIQVDQKPPYLTDLNPGENEINVAPEIQPSFFVRDQISGVDPNSIRVNINNLPAELMIQSDINSGYFVQYIPAKPFLSGEIVTVKIEAADFAHNQMTPRIFTFQINSVLPDLLVENFCTLPNQNLKMNVPFKLQADIFVRNSAVMVPFHLTFYQFTTILKDTLIHSLNQDSLLQVTHECYFPKGNYPFKVIVDSQDEIQECQETNNMVEIMVNVNEGERNIRPNPFTPNNDGYNDIVTFDFTQLVLAEPELKLFTFQGQLVQRIEKASQSIFSWDGNNRNGTPMPPGIYLYVLADGKKTVAKGYVVLAR